MSDAVLKLPGTIPRPRVETGFRDSVASASLTLLQAPLGAGKTTAVVAALAGTPGVAWVDSKPWDRGAFVQALVEAVRRLRPDFGRLTLGAIAAGADAAHGGKTFAEDLTHVDEPLTIVVDNVQVFAADPAFGRFIEAALEALPRSVRLMLIGRSMPDIPLGASVARGRAAVFEGTRLNFDVAEIAALAATLGKTLSREDAEHVLQATEGWAAGVALALEARAPLLPTPSGPQSAAAAYISEELLPALAPELVTFLEETSVFEILDLHVLRSTPAFDYASEQIVQLRKAGALVSALGDDRFRVHPIMRELAANRLRERGGTRAAHRAAAEAYARTANLAAALFHAEAARDAIFSATFLREHIDGALATGDAARLATLAASIDPLGPDADVRFLVEGLLEKARGSPEARERFDRAAAAADDSGDEGIAFRARAQLVEHDLGHLRRIGDAARHELVTHSGALGARGSTAVAVLRGWAAAVAHDFRTAVAQTESLASEGTDRERFDAAILRAYAQTSLGMADAAEATLEALLRSLEASDAVVLQALALVWFARLALMWGRTNEAADAAAQAERLASALSLRAEEAALFIAAAEIATHRGDARAAVRYAERAQRVAERAWYAGDARRVGTFAEVVLARAAFLTGDHAVALELALRAAGHRDCPPTQQAAALAEAAVYSLLAEPQSAGGRIADARRTLDAARPIDAADAFALSVADDVLAFLDLADGRQPQSKASGLEPFAGLIAQRRGLVTLQHAGIAAGNARRAAASPAPFETALDLLTRDGPRFEARLARAYAQRFLSPAAPATGGTSFDADLTPREAEILSLLVDGLTNKEIAQRLIVSPRTVETHVERVLGKLEVGSRSRAIAKAIRLGLVAVT